MSQPIIDKSVAGCHSTSVVVKKNQGCILKMAHYPYCFSIGRLQLAVHMGWEAPERRKPQPVDVDIRLYFPDAPVCMNDDNGPFIDYDGLCNGIHRLVEVKEYRLIEFMANDLFGYTRSYVDAAGSRDVRIWLSLTKAAPPVPHLMGGAAFVLSDLPADATFIHVK